MPVDYAHVELNREVRSISGQYTITKEVRLPFQGREVLYLVGLGVIDNSCCGVGGIAYALVPGFVVEWQTRHAVDGRPVSIVEPIVDDATQRELRALIASREIVSQINFA